MAATFEAETGSGSSTANSYLAVADADQYQENHGNPTAWTASTDAQKQHALREATQYADVKYALRWKGYKAGNTQALDWPRMDVRDNDGYLLDSDALPESLKDFTAIMALKVREGDTLFEDSVPGGTAGGGIKNERVKVGSIEEEIEYTGGKASQKRYTLAERVISELVTDSSTAVRS